MEIKIRSVVVMCACCLEKSAKEAKLIFNRGGVLIFEIENPNPGQQSALFHLALELTENPSTQPDADVLSAKSAEGS